MKIFPALRRIPIIGTYLALANSYAYSGDRAASQSFAPIKLWFKAFFKNVLCAAVLTSITVYPLTKAAWIYLRCGTFSATPLVEFVSKPGALIVSVMPSLLGFGIGVYALLFALGAPFVRQLHAHLEKAKLEGRRKHGSVLMLNADMAFPVAVLLLATMIGVFEQAYPMVAWFQVITWFFFWYALILTLEIVALLFGLVDNTLLDKTVPEDPNVPGSGS